MKLVKVKLRELKMDLKSPFTTSFGTVDQKQFILLEAYDERGFVGYGESVAFAAPWYTEETFKTNWHMLEDFLIPLLLHRQLEHPDEVSTLFRSIRGNPMAKSTIEGAVWDLYAQISHQSLAQALGGSKETIDVGISIGIQKSMDALIARVNQAIEQGFKRVKVKIKPGLDLEIIRGLREKFPELQIMADANSAYTLEDIELLKQFDAYDLMMIEQPLAHDDIVDHAVLQKAIQTPICLDESIHSLKDAKQAVEIGAAQIINLKIGRVGGLTEARRIHDYCRSKNIPVWCGGMLEAGIGRAHNIALTSLTNFVLPGDTAGSSHYFEKDIISPEVIVKDGQIKVPNQIGIGYALNQKAVEEYTISSKIFE